MPRPLISEFLNCLHSCQTTCLSDASRILTTVCFLRQDLVATEILCMHQLVENPRKIRDVRETEINEMH